MRIQNFTKWPLPVLREIIKFCQPSGVTGFDVAFKNSSCFHGRAYTQGCHYHTRSMCSKGIDTKIVPYVVIAVPRGVLPKSRYKKPHITDFGGGYLRSIQCTPVEDMVHVVAHELRHLWQAKVPRGHRVWGARGQFSERDADAFAIRAVREWNRQH